MFHMQKAFRMRSTVDSAWRSTLRGGEVERTERGWGVAGHTPLPGGGNPINSEREVSTALEGSTMWERVSSMRRLRQAQGERGQEGRGRVRCAWGSTTWSVERVAVVANERRSSKGWLGGGEVMSMRLMRGSRDIKMEVSRVSTDSIRVQAG